MYPDISSDEGGDDVTNVMEIAEFCGQYIIKEDHYTTVIACDSTQLYELPKFSGLKNAVFLLGQFVDLSDQLLPNGFHIANNFFKAMLTI